jgi:outer membrane protein assembly factor BamB
MPKEQPSRRRLIAFLILLAVWAIGGAVQGVLWERLEENRTIQLMSVWIIVPTVVFSTLVWWTFFSGFRIVTKLAGWGFLFLTAAVLLVVFRFEGFSGEFIPRFVYRWSATEEEKYNAARKADARYEGQHPALEEPDAPLTVLPGDWPQFRGPNGDGVVAQAQIKRNWDSGPPTAVWQKRVGPAWSSFAVVDGLVFTQMQIDHDDEGVVCYDFESGKEVWAYRDEGVRFFEERAGTGPMGTPCHYRGRLFTLGGTGILNCLNPKTGKKFWSANILADANTVNLTWGIASSPVAFDGKILVNPGSDDDEQTAVAAYDWETGKKLWSGGENPAAYSTPVVATLDGVQQLLVFDGLGLTGHSLENGSQLWHYKWDTYSEINVAKPIVRKDEAVFISSSYDMGSALLRVKKNDDGKWTPALTDWETNAKFKLKFGDAVVKDNMIYGLSETILTCLDFDTGKIVWQQRGSFGYGQLILVDDVLVILTEDGEVVLVEASKKHPELLRFQAIEGKTWGHPVFAQGHLLVRNAAHMACFDLGPDQSTPPGEPDSSEDRKTGEE